MSRAYPPSLTSRALSVDLGGKGLTAADLATLGELGSSLPVLESLTIYEVIIEHHTNLDTGLFESLEVLGIDVNATPSAAWLALGTAGYDGVHRLAEGLGAGAGAADCDHLQFGHRACERRRRLGARRCPEPRRPATVAS